jgi:hypothetical protein
VQYEAMSLARRRTLAALATTFIAIGIVLVVWLRGLAFLVGGALMLTGTLLLIRILISALHKRSGSRSSNAWLANALLVVVSLTVVAMAFEGYLRFSETRAAHPAATITSSDPEGPAASDPEISLSPEAKAAMKAREGFLTMPKEWERRAVQVPGAARANYWHDVLHVYDSNGFRRTTPFPSKQPGVMRVMIVGDSLTWGDGVEERWTYAALLQDTMGRDFHIEFLNLGADGAQSEDVLKFIHDFVPKLNPDLVIYGVCLNDFLPSGKGQYINTSAYTIPIPDSWKAFLADRLRLAIFFTESYDAFLRRFHLRGDFFDDILQNFAGYQSRFASDVKAMNDFVRNRGLPPITAMVLDQFPDMQSRGFQIALAAEKYLHAAGMDVIGVTPFYKKYNGSGFAVSHWEGHPNEEAHAIFAAMLRASLNKNPALAPYRIQH